MVTRSKKPEADAAPKKASKPKVAAKPKAAATKTAAKKTVAKAAPKKAAPKKAAPKKAAPDKAAPKTTAKKTIEVVKVPEGRKVGDMVYNDELLESMAEIILLGSDGISPSALPEIKKQLFDYDIYRVSWLTDEEIGSLAKSLKVPEPALLAVRESAQSFVEIATAYNSVRAFIDKMIGTGEKESAKGKLKAAPECCESFLLLF
ncbi:MAG: hypothetical protein WBZ29_15565 [Methanocella sp.]